MIDTDDLLQRDERARADALDITRSWLVQAPAGSGKTSLLIQRYLALLATVERPERIVAMTFTRKAAAEMRDRIVDALRDAADEVPDSPADGHGALTRTLARDALEQDRRMRWRILDQPSRLRVVTIDALAAAIARQAPLAAGLGALPAFVDDAEPLYREAARAALASAAPDDPHWHAFLQWQDNDAGAATRLIARMLATRDRWPARMFDDDVDALREDVEAVLAHESSAAIALVSVRLPVPLAAALPGFAQTALEGLRATGSLPAFAHALEALCRDRRMPGMEARDAWCALADWLLTKDGGFFKAVGTRHGFASAGRGTGAGERAQRKTEFLNWLVEAAGVPGLADAWHRVRGLPPGQFGDAAWAFVASTMTVLCRAATSLVDVFRVHGQADFAEGTLRALAALGSGGEPSDLLLAIDYRLAHLLIDEFQDTSNAQLALIGRLTEGWQPGDGRTLFAVGDPMQSIYRFRHADVGLFLRAQADARIGSVPVGVVELARNFRSQREIVRWVNDTFASVLPPVSDVSRGEAAYRHASPDPAKATDLAPTLELVGTRDAEANAVVRRIREARAAGIDDIAVLVRARSHARALLPALRRAGVDYSAVDLEGLHDRLATRDLLSLARAIAQPRDRVAWLSVLHAPWCGLDPADLLVIAERADDRSILDAIALPDLATQLPPASCARVAHVLRAVTPALVARGRASFAARVRSAWLALGGPACARTALDRDGVERVFALLAEHDHGGDIADFELLMATAGRLFAAAREAPDGTVQVMTLHRAKGLQFDAVVLPGLDLGTGRNDTPILRWRMREHDGKRALLIAPMRARIGARAEHDPVYRWLGSLDSAESEAELGRLLYVGATRAKRRLHLVAVAGAPADSDAAEAGDWKRPRHGTALARLWDAVARPGPTVPLATPGDVGDNAAAGPTERVRLPKAWRPPGLPPPLPVARAVDSIREEPVFDWADATAAAIGTLAHRLLAQLDEDGLDAWSRARIDAELPRILSELGSEGVEPDQRMRAARQVTEIVARTLGDARGRWIFDPGHADARSEWALAGEDDGRIVHVVLDRTFIADGYRYVVDFKTGAHLGGDRTTFLDREFERYRAQLERYARIVRKMDRRPVRIALYHPLVEGGWQERDAPP